MATSLVQSMTASTAASPPCPSSSTRRTSSYQHCTIHNNQYRHQNQNHVLHYEHNPAGDYNVNVNNDDIVAIAQEVPSAQDVTRLSYYLKCCILGCGIATAELNKNIPRQLLDYTNAHRLPLDWQTFIFQLVSMDTFNLKYLLNRVIFLDDHHQVLPPAAGAAATPNQQQQQQQRPSSHTFLEIKSAEDILLLQRLSTDTNTFSLSSTLPFMFAGKIMICTSEWLRECYVLPLQRYQEQQEAAAAAAAAAAAKTSWNEDEQDDNEDYYAKKNKKRRVCYEGQQHSTSATTSTTESDDNNNNSTSKDCSIDDDDTEHDVNDDSCYSYNNKNELDVPMVSAILLGYQDGDDDEDDVVVEEQQQNHPHNQQQQQQYNGSVVAASLIIPGQMVRLFGLANPNMNGQIAFVEERKDNCVIVHVPNHSCKYSVRVENLVIVFRGEDVIATTATTSTTTTTTTTTAFN